MSAAPVQVLGPDADRPTWLAERRKGLGGSDVAAALGLNPYWSPFALWLEKSGRLDEAREETEAMLMGRLLEPVILDRYQEAHPDIELVRAPGLYRHPEVPYLLGTPDALASSGRVVEAKAPGYDFAGAWEDESTPLGYKLQALTYCLIMGMEQATIVAIIGGQQYVERELDLDGPTADLLLSRVSAWWQRHIIEDTPPELDAAESTTAALKALYEAEPGVVIDLPSQMVEVARDYWRAHEEANAAAERKALAANRFRAAMGRAEIAVADGFGDPLATWKESSVRRVDLDALRKAHPGIVAEFTREVPQRTLRPSKKYQPGKEVPANG